MTAFLYNDVVGKWFDNVFKLTDICCLFIGPYSIKWVLHSSV